MKKLVLVLLSALCACSSTQQSGEVHNAGALSVELVWIKDRSTVNGPDSVHVFVKLHNAGQETIALERDKWLSLSCAGHKGYLNPGATMPSWTLDPGTRREGTFVFRIEEDLPTEESWPVRILVKSAANGKPVPDCAIDIELKNKTYWSVKNRERTKRRGY